MEKIVELIIYQKYSDMKVRIGFFRDCFIKLIFQENVDLNFNFKSLYPGFRSIII